MKLRDLKEVSFLLQNKSVQKIEGALTGFAVDTRILEKGAVFFALPGTQSDGHQFLAEAAKKGASCLVVEKKYRGENFGLPLIRVENTLESLQLLSKKVLSESKAKIVAVTGSVGKTTTKEFLSTLLKEKYKVGKTPGNANSQIGVPLSILNQIDGTEEILVIEMGMNQKGEIKKLIEIAPPDLSILTKVASNHAAGFNSLEEIAFEKAEIFKSPKTKIGVINQNIDQISALYQIGSCRKIPFSLVSKRIDLDRADFYLDDSTLYFSKTALGSGSFSLDKTLHPFFGNHHYEDLTAAIAAAFYLGLSVEEIKRGESKLVLPERRFQILEIQGITFVDDSYNASDASMIAALESLPMPRHNGKRIAVIGEMLELGKFSFECHLRVAKKSLETVDRMLTLGKETHPIFDHWKEKGKPVELFLDRSKLIEALKREVNAGDVVLLKGSKAHQLWKVLEDFRCL